MHYRDVIDQIKNGAYRRILVTGPQRSGTTITAKILAKELGFKYIDENEIKIDNFDKLFLVYQQRKFVLQAPGLAAYAHMMPGAVCFMRRPIEDIVKSQDRIMWRQTCKTKELSKYFRTEGEISEVKYAFWDSWQKTKPNMFEIDYSSIKDHELYLTPDTRKNFKPRQTDVL